MTFRQLLLLIPLLTSVTAMAQREKVEETIHIIKNQGQYPNYVLVSGHRGYWADVPENTLDSYQMAIDIGADIIEMDIRLTKDNVMVVFHDACLDRVTTGYGRLREENWSYVQQLKLKTRNGVFTDYRMLSFESALDFFKDKAVIAVDIKEGGDLFKSTFVRVLKTLKTRGMLYQTILKGKLKLVDLQPLLSEAEVTLDDFIYTPIAFSNTPDLANYLQDYVNTNKIHAIELVYKQSTDNTLTYIGLLINSNIWVGTYSFWPETGDGVIAEKIPLTDTDPIIRRYNFQDTDPTNPLDDGRGDWDWLFPKGANYVITDRSELLIDYLNAQGRRTK